MRCNTNDGKYIPKDRNVSHFQYFKPGHILHVVLTNPFKGAFWEKHNHASLIMFTPDQDFNLIVLVL